MIRALIVDDEPIARNGIRILLADDTQLEIIGECGNGVDAVETIRRERPDLVFLDVQMPDLDGFGVLAALESDEVPTIIFVTAYDSYALRAFDVNAVDYLLKPFDRERFTSAVSRAKTRVRQNHVMRMSAEMVSLLEHLATTGRVTIPKWHAERVLIKDRGQVAFVRHDEIDWIEVRGNYLRLHVGSSSHLVRATLSEMLSRLGASGFIRISRSHAVCAEKVKNLRALPSGRLKLTLVDGTQLESSRRYTKQIAEFFKIT
jgi:two-component system LytT family response regulator